MKETIEKLKASPLFNLSLSSKELFHSNFLFWLGQNYPCEFGALFLKYLKIQPTDTCIKEIFREKENIDLSFIYSNQQEILIENKVKSVPYLTQLYNYSKKQSENKNYILLSLSEPLFFELKKKISINNSTWHYISYSELNLMLYSLTERIKNNYHKQIIIDYQRLIEGLVEIDKLCELKEDEQFNFHSISENIIYKSLIDVRLHDFYLKKKYELLAYAVYKKLVDTDRKLVEFSQPLDWQSDSPMIFFGFGMTRSLGLMDVKYLISKNIALGIQIQGEHYRMVVEDNDGQIAHRIKDDLQKGLWFDFKRSFPNSKVYPNQVDFNKYGKVFFYKSVKLGTKKTIKEILNIIIKDIEEIEINMPRIQEAISRF